MSQYYIFNGQIYSHDELKHYGVRGMKWGIRRGLNELREANQSGSKGGHNHAVAVLSGHRDKINKKLGALDKKSVKLEKKRYEQETKDAPKIAKLERKSEKALLKSYKTKSVEKAEKYRQKSISLNYKANKLKESTAKTKAKIEKNERMKEIYKKGLSDINQELVTKGQDFLYMKSNGVPYTNADVD
jgi:hypothetical protein